MISIFGHVEDDTLERHMTPDVILGAGQFDISIDLYGAVVSGVNKVTVAEVLYEGKYWEPLEVLDLKQYESWVKLKEYVPDLSIYDILSYLESNKHYKKIIDLFITKSVSFRVPKKIEKYLVSKGLYNYVEPLPAIQNKIQAVEEMYLVGTLYNMYKSEISYIYKKEISEFISSLEELDTKLFPCTVEEYLYILDVDEYDTVACPSITNKIKHFLKSKDIEDFTKIPAIYLYTMGDTSYLDNTYMFDWLYDKGCYAEAFDIYDKGAVFSIVKDIDFTRSVLEKQRKLHGV